MIGAVVITDNYGAQSQIVVAVSFRWQRYMYDDKMRVKGRDDYEGHDNPLPVLKASHETSWYGPGIALHSWTFALLLTLVVDTSVAQEKVIECLNHVGPKTLTMWRSWHIWWVHCYYDSKTVVSIVFSRGVVNKVAGCPTYVHSFWILHNRIHCQFCGHQMIN